VKKAVKSKVKSKIKVKTKTPAKVKITAKPMPVAKAKFTAKPTTTSKPNVASKPKLAAKAKVKTPAANLSSERVGILGGVFNPVHIGHLNLALSVKQILKLDKVILVPCFRSPNREVTGPTPDERLEMLKLATKTYQPELEVSEIELKRKGVSYTVDTLQELGKTYKAKNIYFIMGADNFATFTKWKDFELLLSLANYAVATRPQSLVDFDEDALSKELVPYIKKVQANQLKLKSGMTIETIDIDGVDVSSTEIRKRLRVSHEVKNMMPPAVTAYIDEHKLYQRTMPLVKDYREFSIYCGRKANDKKALALKIYDMTKNNGYTDYSVICSATSTKHAASIADGVIRSAKDDFGLSPISLEGARDGRWVLIDFGPVVVHVFEDAVRAQYQIEQLWKSCRQLQDEMSQSPQF
jgi:nicotinate-nucleotide adenylyltransferase